MNTKRYYIVKATQYGLKYYRGDNSWTYTKSKAVFYSSEEEAFTVKNEIKN